MKKVIRPIVHIDTRQLTDQEILVKLARESLERYGTAVPPPDPSEPDWKKTLKVCPSCGDSKPVNPGFGFRVVRGVVGPQSYCGECRASTNYYQRPRKYRSKHNR